MSEEQVADVVSSIVANDPRLICELADSEIMMYLVDHGIEDTVENVALIRKA